MKFPDSILQYLQYFRESGRVSDSAPQVIRELFQKNSDTDLAYALHCRQIDAIQGPLKKDKGKIKVSDKGAGPGSVMVQERKISDIALHSTQRARYGRLQHRMIQHLKPKTILELGTSFGFTTALMALAAPDATVITIEGCENTANIAAGNFSKLGLSNIQLLRGDFDEILDKVVKEYKSLDYVYFDGNHRMVPTLNYFLKALPCATESSVFVFDDIHWSDQMISAWNEIIRHPRISLSLDVFAMGMIMFDKKMPQQNLVIRY